MHAAIEVATRRKVFVVTGANGLDGLVTFRYEGESQIRAVTREAFFGCGYFVACSTTFDPSTIPA